MEPDIEMEQLIYPVNIALRLKHCYFNWGRIKVAVKNVCELLIHRCCCSSRLKTKIIAGGYLRFFPKCHGESMVSKKIKWAMWEGTLFVFLLASF